MPTDNAVFLTLGSYSTPSQLSEDFENGEIGIIQLLTKSGLATSNGDARRAITKDGSIKISGRKVTDPFEKLTKDGLADGETVISKGKKNFKKIVVE